MVKIGLFKLGLEPMTSRSIAKQIYLNTIKHGYSYANHGYLTILNTGIYITILSMDAYITILSMGI